ncbi:MAG: hypothetical protein M3518_02795 [Actinomycetota bacterium]|jgi:hypothetical protein|nr:hypothetical protein [Actinomycetota bacterium]
MLRPDHAEGRPFLIFDTEQEYRDHLGEVLGKRIGREQRKLATAQETIAELEAELAALRREGIGRGTPLRPD